ncbi:MAG: hypothetical protein KF869_10525 [Phycisphaeraceae bacterium]|nr:hypothetical protein [Phycisphaeraceae bacterium]
MIAAGFAGGAAADVVHVKHDATGAGTGQSWADAFTDLHAALAAAQPGDELWVARGTYRPAAPGGDRAASFVLKGGVPLYGGFAGMEAVRSQRNVAANPTVLSGDLNGDDGPEFANTADNSFRIVTAIGVGEGLVLDGFVIRGGRADGEAGGDPGQSKDRGAALMIHGGTLHAVDCLFERNWTADFGAVADCGDGSTFTRCVFADNYSESGAAGLLIDVGAATVVLQSRFERNTTPGEGAGALVRSDAGARFEESHFYHNTANRGGGLAFVTDSGGLVIACEFEHNHAYEGGGASAFGCAPRFEYCNFHFNSAEISGGGLFGEAASPVVITCTFGQCTSAVGVTEGGGGQGGFGGGGMWLRGGGGLLVDICYNSNFGAFGGGLYIIEGNTAEIIGCMFINNTANEGAGFYNLSSTPRLTGGLFTGNHASVGSFAVGGAISNYFSPGTVIANSYFAHNLAELGGGAIYNEGEDPLIINCVFHRNEAYADYAGWGGGVLNGFFTHGQTVNCVFIANRARFGGAFMDLYGTEARIINCSLVGNHADVEGGAIYGYIGHASEYVNCVIVGNTPTQIEGVILPEVTWSLVQGGYPGLGVFDASPGFVRMPTPGPDGEWDTLDDDFGDLTPAPNSLLIDAGNPGALPEGLETDLAGAARDHDDTGTPFAGPAEWAGLGSVDIGAFEFQGVSCIADFDGIGGVQVGDIFTFLSAWFAGDLRADMDRSRSLGVNDIFAFLAAWFAGCP